MNYTNIVSNMKEYKIYYEESGTVYNYCKAWVAADSEEEAVKALKENNWDKILDTDMVDSDYGDDYSVNNIVSVEVVGEYKDDNKQ